MSELMERQRLTGDFTAENTNYFLNRTPEYDVIKNYLPDFPDIASNFSKLEVCSAIKDYLTYRRLSEICYVPVSDEDTIRAYNQKGFPHSKNTVLRTITHYKGEDWDDTQTTKTKEQCYVYIVPTRKFLSEEERLLKFLLLDKFPNLAGYSFEVCYLNNPQIEFSAKYYNEKIVPPLEIPAYLHKYTVEQREEIFDKAVEDRIKLIKELYPNVALYILKNMIYMGNEQNFREAYTEGKTIIQFKEEDVYSRLFQYFVWKGNNVLDEWACYIEYTYSASGRHHVRYTYKEVKMMLKSIMQKTPLVFPPFWNYDMKDFYLHIYKETESVKIRKITFVLSSELYEGCVLPFGVEAIEALKILVKSVTKIKKDSAIFQNVDKNYETSKKTVVIPKGMVEYFSFLKNPKSTSFNVPMYPISALANIRKREGYSPYIVKTEVNGEKVLFKVTWAMFKVVCYYATNKEKLKEVENQDCTNVREELELISLF